MAKAGLLILVLAAPVSCVREPLGSRDISVDLAYERFSNWGPREAWGGAGILTVNGAVDVFVSGLPILENEEYEVWLMGGGEEPASVGRFNTIKLGVPEDPIGMFLRTLSSLEFSTFRRVVITVERVPDDDPGPDRRCSIGGYIPVDPE